MASIVTTACTYHRRESPVMSLCQLSFVWFPRPRIRISRSLRMTPRQAAVNLPRIQDLGLVSREIHTYPGRELLLVLVLHPDVMKVSRSLAEADQVWSEEQGSPARSESEEATYIYVYIYTFTYGTVKQANEAPGVRKINRKALISLAQEAKQSRDGTGGEGRRGETRRGRHSNESHICAAETAFGRGFSPSPERSVGFAMSPNGQPRGDA